MPAALANPTHCASTAIVSTPVPLARTTTAELSVPASRTTMTVTGTATRPAAPSSAPKHSQRSSIVNRDYHSDAVDAGARLKRRGASASG